MNPNALFELFGVFSGQTSLQVRKAMFKYLGITKKRGAEQGKTFMNAWITLHMQGVTACQWPDAMLDRETPGDEIALYTLCRMYHHHCVVITSAKCWTTFDTDSPLPEAVLYENCDIKLLYIEPGVFGELRLKPAMPPVPTNTFITESATAIVPRNALTDNNELQPINLSRNIQTEVKTTVVKPKAIGNNNTQSDSVVNMESVFDPYINASLSGALDHINYLGHLDDLLNMFLVKQHKPQIPLQFQMNNQPSPDESVPEFPMFTKSSSINNIVKECDILLTPLSYIDMEAWLKLNDTLNDKGYNLCQPKDNANVNVPVLRTYTSRYGRMVKPIVSPVENLSTFSEDDDDMSVKLRRGSQPRQHNTHVPPVSGPSMSRLKAQKLMQRQKEQAAAQALLGLYQQNVALSDNEDYTDQDDSTTDTVDIDSEPSSVAKTDEPESTNDAYSDSDEIPLAKLKKDQVSASTSHSDSNEIPLAKLIDKTKSYGKPYFKTKSYQLFKRK